MTLAGHVALIAFCLYACVVIVGCLVFALLNRVFWIFLACLSAAGVVGLAAARHHLSPAVAVAAGWATLIAALALVNKLARPAQSS